MTAVIQSQLTRKNVEEIVKRNLDVLEKDPPKKKRTVNVDVADGSFTFGKKRRAAAHQ